MTSDLPYRPCVGVMLLNAQGRVWVGRRADMPGEPECLPEGPPKGLREGLGEWWQMPQGGIDEGEDVTAAALRELAEETGVQSAEIIAESRDWFTYELPDHLVGVAWKGRFRGQRQKWLAARFTGRDGEIDIAPEGHKAEFDKWKWAPIDDLTSMIVPFKRAVYEQVVAEFRPLVSNG